MEPANNFTEHIPYELHTTSNYHAHHQRPVFYSDANFVLLPLPHPPSNPSHLQCPYLPRKWSVGGYTNNV